MEKLKKHLRKRIKTIKGEWKELLNPKDWDSKTRRDIMQTLILMFVCVYFGMILYCLLNGGGVPAMEENASFTDKINIFKYKCVPFKCIANKQACQTGLGDCLYYNESRDKTLMRNIIKDLMIDINYSVVQ